MRALAEVSVVLLCVLILAGATQAPKGPPPPSDEPPVLLPLLYKPAPLVLTVAELPEGIDSATVTDVELADFDGDGRTDIAVAWYATDLEDMQANLRVLTIYFNEVTSFSVGAQLDLYIPDSKLAALSIFRNGTADVGLGDFDGDGDVDLAVTAFFGDELWFIENLGGGAFAQHLRFPFGFNSPGFFLTPPEALAADFDGDGRDDLVYIADPVQYWGGPLIHFWKTSGSIENIYRFNWEGLEGGVLTQWTRGLAIADFNADGRPDLCYSGSMNPPQEDDPVLTFWYDLNLGTGRFAVHNEFPSVLCSDVVDVQPDPACPPGVLLADLDGTTVQYWAHGCAGQMDFWQSAEESGYAALSENRGLAGVVADVDGDGDRDLVTKQKLGCATDANQIEITLCSAQGATWTRVSSLPIDTSGFHNDQFNEILRPRNLAVADLYGNTLPEIVAGFGASPASPHDPEGVAATLSVAIWDNSCLGDVTRDGTTDEQDASLLYTVFDTCDGEPLFDANADLDKDGCVGESDLSLLLDDWGCVCAACAGELVGDANCDGVLNSFDVDSFVLAIAQGEAAWLAAHGQAGCNFLCVNDVNGDGLVNAFDVDPFVELFTDD